MARHSAAHYLLSALVDLGIEYIFANLGTDYVSLIEELARWDAEGRPHPKVILCPHEIVAVHMAGGYAMATGRGQAVFVHVDAGTANACMAVQNLCRYRLPVLLFAGKAPYTLRGELVGSRDTYVHFVQDPFDMASIVRPYVKWEYSLPSGVVVREALARANAFMHSDPQGPVYMMLPRETLAENWDASAMPAYPPARFGDVRSGGVDQARVEMIADALMKASKPVAIASYLGRNPRAPGLLDQLAQACGIRVVEYNAVHSNISQDSPCFAGFDPMPLLKDADLGILLDTDVPYLPQAAAGIGALPWIQIDIDPLKTGFPMWGFPTDVRIQANTEIVLEQLLAVIEAKSDAAFRQRVRERVAGWAPFSTALADKRVKAAASPGSDGAINPAHLLAVLNSKLSQDDVVVNEAIRNGPVLQEQIRRTAPGSYVGLAGGGLGYSGGLALGLKLAQPQRRIVQVIGDGGFHFSSPDSVFAVAQQYELPIFTIVLDNGGWQAVKSSVQRVYPDGYAAQSNAFHSLLTSRRQGEMRKFSEVGRAFGAHSEHISHPDEIGAAIDRCLSALAEGRAAVLHAQITQL